MKSQHAKSLEIAKLVIKINNFIFLLLIWYGNYPLYITQGENITINE